MAPATASLPCSRPAWPRLLLQATQQQQHFARRSAPSGVRGAGWMALRLKPLTLQHYNAHTHPPPPHAHHPHTAPVEDSQQPAASSAAASRSFFSPKQARPPHGCLPISSVPLAAAVAAHRVAPSHQKRELLSTPLFFLCLRPSSIACFRFVCLPPLNGGTHPPAAAAAPH